MFFNFSNGEELYEIYQYIHLLLIYIQLHFSTLSMLNSTYAQHLVEFFSLHIISFTNLLINLNVICRTKASIPNFVYNFFSFTKSALYNKI